jgi:hypothetical protein
MSFASLYNSCLNHPSPIIVRELRSPSYTRNAVRDTCWALPRLSVIVVRLWPHLKMVQMF